MMKKRYLSSILVAAAAATAAIGFPAGATPGSGASGAIVARGTADAKVKSHSTIPTTSSSNKSPSRPEGTPVGTPTPGMRWRW